MSTLFGLKQGPLIHLFYPLSQMTQKNFVKLVFSKGSVSFSLSYNTCLQSRMSQS